MQSVKRLQSYSLALLQRLAVHQGLSLRQVVGQQDGVVLPDGMVGGSRGDEVARHNLLALVDELVEGVLAVGACACCYKNALREERDGPGSPHTMGPVDAATRVPSTLTDLPLLSMSPCWK